MARKDLLDIAALEREEIDLLLEQSGPFKELFTRSVKKVPALKGKSVLMLFYEPSTRTHSSFEVAAKRLSADVTNFDVAQSSITKGESVRETVETLQAMRTDYIIVRHKASGLPGMIAKQTKACVINAGDGAHAHPTQALLDAFTIKEKFPDPAGKKVLIIGDILHSRVARSTTMILKKLGLRVAHLGPGSLVPRTCEQVQRFTSYTEAMAWQPCSSLTWRKSTDLWRSARSRSTRSSSARPPEVRLQPIRTVLASNLPMPCAWLTATAPEAKSGTICASAKAFMPRSRMYERMRSCAVSRRRGLFGSST